MSLLTAYKTDYHNGGVNTVPSCFGSPAEPFVTQISAFNNGRNGRPLALTDACWHEFCPLTRSGDAAMFGIRVFLKGVLNPDR
jgi:hypothetical protein